MGRPAGSVVRPARLGGPARPGPAWGWGHGCGRMNDGGGPMKWWAWGSAGVLILAAVAVLAGKDDIARIVRMHRM